AALAGLAAPAVADTAALAGLAAPAVADTAALAAPAEADTAALVAPRRSIVPHLVRVRALVAAPPQNALRAKHLFAVPFEARRSQHHRLASSQIA
ncbi:MAG TPA: hypothetical protein PK140_11515, partial [Polyangiaceae bacterium]|nr:hypothetical protein [Polyangiaceae bacterium]HOR36060.1 hypothetical protein [Polyangiaceae bacterium]HPY16673.1 hypothetical protein [Polyangiaceae bacterium]HQM10019.1 hypothetical protein [Polyangiaceae bacterium]